VNVAPNKRRLAKAFIVVYVLIAAAWLAHAVATTRGPGKEYVLGPEIENFRLTAPFEAAALAGKPLDQDMAHALKRAGIVTVFLESGKEVLVDNGVGQRLRSIPMPKGTHITEELWNLVLAEEARQRPDAKVVIGGTGTVLGFSLDLVLVLVNFLGLLCLLYVFFWDPLLAMLDHRAEMIRSQLAEAKNEREKARSLRDKYAGLIEGAKKEREELIAGGEREGEAERQKTLERARREAEKVLARAGEDIQGEEARARRNLRREVVSLSAEIAAEILRRELKPRDHETLIQEFLDKADAGGGNGDAATDAKDT
jgi:F-type H+-transporting ATPase subunit b